MKYLTWTLFAVVVLGSPIVGDLVHFSLFPIAMGVLVAYYGLTYPFVSWSLGILVIAEILWGIDFGVLSLAYLGMILVLRFAEHSLAITSVARVRDWSVTTLLWGIMLAGILSVVMTFFSAVVQSLVYQQGGLGELLRAAYHPVGSVAAFTALASAGGTIVLHRIRIPFRKPIAFGI